MQKELLRYLQVEEEEELQSYSSCLHCILASSLIMFTKFPDSAWFLCLVIWLGPGDGDGHTAANVTGLESGEHASGRTGRHEESVGWSSFEQAKDKVAMLVEYREYREHVRDGILQG